ncbi:gas vesicle protein GvpL/GvpF [Nonomuraea polychroma]|uniref:Gas vesicle protein GvpL/GvpF n=1 Tax=Nonomuraea polychroma TaxID=46176 RepID=A0A438M3Q9_9ACTN|nr:GvpL/GvpF family gas vesicle protein [Nonomuraea polychroma]RVX40435.1 gas vesicle protein GvpL/GvpF [Nonomuraea polychroma]
MSVATEPGIGVYVYGMVPKDAAVTEDARGVGEKPGEIMVIQHGEIAALVSEIPLDRPLGTPDDLLRHQGLLDATAAEAPVLPLRFGAVVTSAEAVVEDLLEPHHDELHAALKELEGRAQYVVKGRYVEQTVLREVMEELPEVARLRDEIRARGEEAARDLRIRLGELVGDAIAAKREADTRALLEAAAPVSVLSAEREPSHEQDAVHVALLVEKDRQAELEQTVADFAGRWAGRVEFRLLGPLAAYDFVVSGKDGAQWE